MYTEDDKNEILYPNSFCGLLRNWWKYTLSCEGLKFIDGFQDRQRKIHEALRINCDDKSYMYVAVHLRDIVAAMIVSFLRVLL